MAISAEAIEKVRHAVDIVDVIGSYVPLKKAGTYYRGLSPFQKEKTPSFMVSPSRQSFKCYSSGHGGDVFKFLMLYENIDFPTAIRKLAEKAGIEIVDDWRGKKEGAGKAVKETLLRLHRQLALHWRDILFSGKEGEHAREYLKARHIPMTWIKEFGLGYAPEVWDGTVTWAKKEGFSEEDLVQSGVAVRGERDGKLYDRFRGRLVFPINDESGRAVGFSGRILKEDAKLAKYVNSPETMLFKKGKILFGFDRAKRAILDAEKAIVCEGQIDVLRCHSAGVLNAVAPLGTAFTREHARLLKRFTDRIVLCLDADRAGSAAAMRLGEMLAETHGEHWGEALAEAEFGIFVARLPSGHDPDSLIREQGAEAFREILNGATDFLDFYVAELSKREKGETAAGHRRVVEAIARLIGKVENAVVRDRLVVKAANRLQIADTLLNSEVQKMIEKEKQRSARAEAETEETIEATPPPLDVHPFVQAVILVALSEPSLIADVQRRIPMSWIKDLAGAALLEHMIETHTQDDWSTMHELYEHVGAAEQNYLSGLIGEELDALVSLSMEERLRDLAHLARRIETDYLNRRMAQTPGADELTKLMKRRRELGKS